MGVAQENALEKMIDAMFASWVRIELGDGSSSAWLPDGHRTCSRPSGVPIRLRVCSSLGEAGARPTQARWRSSLGRCTAVFGGRIAGRGTAYRRKKMPYDSLVPCGTRLISFPRRTFGSASGSVA